MTTQSLHPVQTLLRPGALAHPLNWRFDKKMLFFVCVLICFGGMVVWAHLNQQSQTAALHTRIENHRDEINRLNHMNADIEVEIASATQIETIAVRARQLGFGPTKHNVYLLVPEYPVESDVSWQVNPLSGIR